MGYSKFNELADEFGFAVCYLQGIEDSFGNTFFNSTTLEFIEKWKKIKLDLEHKPFHPTSENHQKFLKTTLKNLINLSSEIDVSIEMKWVESQIVQ